MITEGNEAAAPVDTAAADLGVTPATTEGGNSLVVAVAAVVVLSIAIGAGAVIYSKGKSGGDNQQTSS